MNVGEFVEVCGKSEGWDVLKPQEPEKYNCLGDETLLQYLRTEPSPMSQRPLTYTPDCISRLLEKLRPYELSKGEVVMILNLRPASVAALNTIIEDMPERFPDEEQEQMVNIVAEILGQFEVAEAEDGGDAPENGDVKMDEASAAP
ncbi:hypothetical protein UVI_02013160 [Ustilaginoidea virens]|uniref:DNA-directed RNA polymerase III subunit RPC9 n=1 Tax=Ustilaginoidea virens TaxID=1159556 RepID=A0A1B5KRD1_USTVR|nr:hypothetical protein UVI_02013160 [Ustilaginoidea virens]